MIEPGAAAPDFTLPDQHGRPVSLAGLRGRTVVVYFYPRAGTPGCTAQACGVRDRRGDYEEAGAVVLGISPDPVEALAAFAAEHRLDFPLLSDADHAVAEAYGAWVEKSMYGKRFMGVGRATVIVDPEGRVAHVLPKVHAKTHDDRVLAALAAAGWGPAAARVPRVPPVPSPPPRCAGGHDDAERPRTGAYPAGVTTASSPRPGAHAGPGRPRLSRIEGGRGGGSASHAPLGGGGCVKLCPPQGAELRTLPSSMGGV